MTDAVITLDVNGSVMLSNPQGEKIVEEWSTIEWSDDEGEPRRFPKPDTALGDWGLMSFSNPSSRCPIPVPLIPLFEAVVDESAEAATKLHVQNGVWSVAMTPLYSREHVRGAVAVLRDVTEEDGSISCAKILSRTSRTSCVRRFRCCRATVKPCSMISPPRRRNAWSWCRSFTTSRSAWGASSVTCSIWRGWKPAISSLSFREVEIDSLVKRMHRKFAVLAKERGIALSVTLPEEPLILQRADEDRLEQVLTNLLDNAFRHTPAGARIALNAEPCRSRIGPRFASRSPTKGRGFLPRTCRSSLNASTRRTKPVRADHRAERDLA